MVIIDNGYVQSIALFSQSTGGFTDRKKKGGKSN
jgi:hypothetical protein